MDNALETIFVTTVSPCILGAIQVFPSLVTSLKAKLRLGKQSTQSCAATSPSGSTRAAIKTATSTDAQAKHQASVIFNIEDAWTQAIPSSHLKVEIVGEISGVKEENLAGGRTWRFA